MSGAGRRANRGAAALILTLSGAALGLATCRTRQAGRTIAYLQSGEVWLRRVDDAEARQLTYTDGRVMNFALSRQMNYLALSRSMADTNKRRSSGDRSPSPVTLDAELTVMRMTASGPVSTIMTIPSPVAIAKWISDDRLLCYRPSEFDVAGFRIVDASRGTLTGVDEDDANRLWEGDVSADQVALHDIAYSVWAHDSNRMQSIA